MPQRDLGDDPLAMRALAHPLRLRLLEELTLRGPLTATQCADLPVLVVCLTTAIQRRTPAGLQGRAFTAFELFVGVPQLVSILAGAVAVSLLDYRIPLSVMGIGLVAAGVYSWPQLRDEATTPGDLPSELADPAGVDLHVPVASDVVQQAPVVGHEQDGPVVRR